MSKLDTCCRACADEYTLRHVIIQCPVCGKTDCSKAYNHTNPCVWSGLVPGVAAGMIDNPNPQMDDRTDLRAENARLKDALEKIAEWTNENFCENDTGWEPLRIARAALEVKP